MELDNVNEVLEGYTQLSSNKYYTTYECDISIVEHLKFLKIDEINTELYNKYYAKENKSIYYFNDIINYNPDLYVLNYLDMHIIQSLYDKYMSEEDLSNIQIILNVRNLYEQDDIIKSYEEINQLISPNMKINKNCVYKWLDQKTVISKSDEVRKPNIPKSRLEEELINCNFLKYLSESDINMLLTNLNKQCGVKYNKAYKEWQNRPRRRKNKKDEEEEEEESKPITMAQIEKAKEKNCFFGFDTKFEWLFELDNKAKQIIFS
jgi:hypothetical protein